MKKCKSIFCTLIVTILLLGAVPAYAVDTDTGYNGTSGNKSNFDYSYYDAIVTMDEVMYAEELGQTVTYTPREDFTWPNGTKILLKINDRVWTYGLDMDDVPIPEGKIIDAYYFGMNYDTTYELWGHYDTTDGKTTTIGGENVGSNTGNNSSDNTGNTGNTGNSNAGNNSSNHGTYANTYDDVQPGDWYYDAVMTLTEGGLFNGYGNGKFGPNDVITWGQFQIVVSRLTGGQAYGEVSSINLGTDVNKMTMTRGLTAVKMVEAYNRYCFGYRVYPNNDFTSVDDFPDSEDIINWCYEYQTEIYPLVNNGAHVMGPDMTSARNLANSTILKSYELNMFHGTDSKGTFSPYSPLTRAQFCQILYNMGWLTANCEYFTK